MFLHGFDTNVHLVGGLLIAQSRRHQLQYLSFTKCKGRPGQASPPRPMKTLGRDSNWAAGAVLLVVAALSNLEDRLARLDVNFPIGNKDSQGVHSEPPVMA